MSRPVDWCDLGAELRQFMDSPESTAPFIKRLIHEYLKENRQYLIDTAVGLDRTYLSPFIGKILDDSNIVELLTAIAEAEIDEGLRQTS